MLMQKETENQFVIRMRRDRERDYDETWKRKPSKLFNVLRLSIA